MNAIYIISSEQENSPQVQPVIQLLESTLKKYWEKLSIRQRLDLSEILARYGQDANQDLFYSGDGLNIQLASSPSIVFFKNSKIEVILTESQFTEENIFNTLQKVYAKPPWPQWVWWLSLAVSGIGTFESEKPVVQTSWASLGALSIYFLNRNRR